MGGEVMLNPRIASALFLMVTGAGWVHGQDYPSKPIRVVTSAPGGGGDIVARQIVQPVSGPLGQPVIVDNRASGLLASDVVSKTPPDGYNLVATGSSFWVIPLLQKAPYEVNDFSPISLLVREVNVLAVHPSVPVKSVKELIALAKARPGEINAGISVLGSPAHLSAELFKALAGVKIVGVPYKGAAVGVTALIAGEVQMSIVDIGLVTAHMKTGKVRALAITNAQPSPLVPGLPTVAASLPGFEWVAATGLWAPAKTPTAIISRLNQEVVRVINSPDVKERFFVAGIETVGTSPEEFAAIIKSDMARVSKVIKDAGIKVD
jgi:tripartite-type tricarboxylate transporter receptor subunit TctC